MLSGADCFSIRSEEFFQCLRIASGHDADGIGSREVFFPSSEVLPEMHKMIERVRVDPLLDRIGPLLVRDGHVANWPSDGSSKGFDHVFHCWSFADQWVYILRRHTRVSQQSRRYTGYVLRADERNNRRSLAPGRKTVLCSATLRLTRARTFSK